MSDELLRQMYWGPDADGDYIVTALGDASLYFAVPDEEKARAIVARLAANPRSRLCRGRKLMGEWYPQTRPDYTPRQPTPAEPSPPQEPTPDEKALLASYHVLRIEISQLEEQIADEKELDKAVVLLKVGCKLIKKRLRKIGYSGPLRIRERALAGADDE